MHRVLSRFVCAALLVAGMLAAPGMAADDKPITITILAQPPGTGPYNYATTMAKFLGDALPKGSTINIVPRGGSMVNPTALDMGRGDIGIASSTASRWAWEGDPNVYPKYGKHENIRLVIMGNLTVNYTFAAARKEYVDRTGNDTLEKVLNAKEMPRIAMKPAGSEIPPLFTALFRNMGKDIEDYRKAGRLIQVQPSQIGEMMRDGRVDIYLESPPLNHPSVTEIALTNDLIFLPISEEEIKKLNDAAGTTRAVLAAGSFRGVSEDYPTAASGNNIIASKDAPEEAVYLLTKALIERRAEFIDENPPTRSWDPENDSVEGNPVPLHPGAERYYREIGWIK